MLTTPRLGDVSRQQPGPKLEILWQGMRAEQAVVNLEVDGRLIHPNSPSQHRLADELEDLFCALFPDAQTLMVQPMWRGRSGAGVLKVLPCYLNRGVGYEVVVKFGDADLIQEEYDRYREYVQDFIESGTHTLLQTCKRTEHLGGIVCSFLGTTTDQLQDFATFYHQANADAVKGVLDRLFHQACGPWHANHRTLWPLNLTKDYQHLVRNTPEQFEHLALERLQLAQGKEMLIFPSLEKHQGEGFPNPFRALNRLQPFYRLTYISTNHGDMNQHNILVDTNRHPWLIDFQKTGPAHILRDVAMLDATIRFHLLRPGHASLDERFAMEEALCSIRQFSQVEQLPARFSTENPVLAKAYEVVAYLRTLARQLVDKLVSDDISEYSIALLYHALINLRFSILDAVQLKHALLSTCLLVASLE